MAQGRPAIPAELKRRVLVEAGHRCSIHTCRHPATDVHHIVPWEQCQEHSYENLIALCPNCHRRADAEEIDRISLRMYKARLVAAVGTGPAPQPQVGWTVERVKETHAESPRYDFEWEFPQLASDEADVAEFNLLQRVAALKELCQLREVLITRERESEGVSSRPVCLTASFDVTSCTEAVISVRYSVFYDGGGAHPAHWTRVVNYRRNPLTVLTISSLFTDRERGLTAISKYSIARLTSDAIHPSQVESIASGARPTVKNYERFNITARGLLITFDEYQIGSYVDGQKQVEVPADLVAPLVNPRTRALEIWQVG